jgi:hypothetical protein
MDDRRHGIDVLRILSAGADPTANNTAMDRCRMPADAGLQRRALGQKALGIERDVIEAKLAEARAGTGGESAEAELSGAVVAA